jgi:hypothetical protein
MSTADADCAPAPPSRPDWPRLAMQFISITLKVFSVLAVVWNALLQAQVSRLKNELEGYQTVRGYLEELARPSPNSGVVLGSLLRFRLMEPSQLFSAAFRLRDRCGDAVLQDLLNQYQTYPSTLDEPIGVVDLPRPGRGAFYEIGGWVLDKQTGVNLEVSVDGVPLSLPRLKSVNSDGEGVLRGPRQDLDRLKAHYADRTDAGFVIRLLKANYPPATRRITLRAVNRQMRAMVLFDDSVRFAEFGVSAAEHGGCGQ